MHGLCAEAKSMLQGDTDVNYIWEWVEPKTVAVYLSTHTEL